MHRGQLSDYFDGVAVKQLSAVEASPKKSNQHELNGSTELKLILGDTDRKNIPTRFIWMGQEQEALTIDGQISWYDARRRHPKRSEYRLYYYSNDITSIMQVGDVIFLATCKDGSAMFVVVPIESTIQNQLLWLFGLEEQPELQFKIQNIQQNQNAELDFAARYILEELGIELEEPEIQKLDGLIEPFGLTFPTTKVFSEIARNSLSEISAIDDPDAALLAWIEREEQLFRRLERRIVEERISNGFDSVEGADVDGFLKFSLSVQNRRKSRAGQALEHHLEAIFISHRVSYDRGTETENRHKPDFLFPGQTEYHNPDFPASHLAMLGAKSSLKDRWRQVLAEAQRIEEKHLLTLEPGISRNQTDQMQASMLRLVVPQGLHTTYKLDQQSWLLKLSDMISIVKRLQDSA